MTQFLYRADAVLRDGGSVHVRALRPDDKERLFEFFAGFSRPSVYFRFFKTNKWFSEQAPAACTTEDFEQAAVLVAVLREEGRENIIGAGRYFALEDAQEGTRCADVALAVADAHQRRGIGTLLLAHLTALARSNGITEFEADVLGENNRMLRLLAGSGFKVKQAREAGILHVSFPTEETEELIEAQMRRERQAEAQSVRPILDPRSVAVIGASRNEGSIGAAIVRNLKRCKFTGSIYPVNPNASEIQGLPAYARVTDVKAPIDLAVIAVPAQWVEETVHDCARAGVRGVVIISSGLGEVSEEGKQTERRLRELVRSSGMRMVGPNCMGVLNTDPAVSLNATFVGSWPPAGNVGMLSQSGALGLTILDRTEALNFGLSSFISVGNKADISGNDLLAYWADDPRTQIIVLYLESFGNPRKFARVAPEVARSKPIVAVKSGRSAAGTRAASSHSAALASLDIAVDALFEQAGVIRTDTLEQLMDVAILLSSQPVPPGNRVGVVTNAGGPGILLADACEARGLKLPELAPKTVESLRSFLPPQAGFLNPVDMIASAGPEEYARAIELVGNDPNVDSVVAVYIPPQLNSPEEVARAIAEGAGKTPADKPVLTVFMSSRGAPPILSTGPRGRLPSYSYPENAALALSSAERYARWKRRPAGRVLELDHFARSAVRAVIDRALEATRRPVWLSAPDVATVFRAVGIEFAAAEEVAVRDALAVAERMGYPLVLKVQSTAVLHKSDVGGVILGLQSREEVARSLETMRQRMDAIGVPLERVLLQREVRGGLEALVGVTKDATFGPLVVCGLGGVLVELLKDVSFRLWPVSDIDAEEMVAGLRSSRLLDGYRGSPPGDRQALLGVVQRISALVDVVPEIRELDVNPVKVLEPGRGAIAVDGRIRIGPLE